MAVGDAHVFPGFLRQALTQLSFQSHKLLFSHASIKVRGKTTSERKFALTGYRTHIYQVMIPTRSLLSHPSHINLEARFAVSAKIADQG